MFAVRFPLYVVVPVDDAVRFVLDVECVVLDEREAGGLLVLELLADRLVLVTADASEVELLDGLLSW